MIHTAKPLSSGFFNNGHKGQLTFSLALIFPQCLAVSVGPALCNTRRFEEELLQDLHCWDTVGLNGVFFKMVSAIFYSVNQQISNTEVTSLVKSASFMNNFSQCKIRKKEMSIFKKPDKSLQLDFFFFFNSICHSGHQFSEYLNISASFKVLSTWITAMTCSHHAFFKSIYASYGEMEMKSVKMNEYPFCL